MNQLVVDGTCSSEAYFQFLIEPFTLQGMHRQ